MKSDAEKCLDKIALELSEGRITEEEAQAFREEVEAKAQQRQKLNEDFKNGKIDEIGFNQWQISIAGDFEKLAEDIDLAAVHKKRKALKTKKLKQLTMICGVLLIVLVGAGMVMIPTWQHAHRSIAGIPEPIQIDIDEAIAAGRVKEARKTISGKGYSVKMKYLAEYDIRGLVVTLDDYDKEGASAFDMAIPRDISMAWGKAAEYASEIKWGHAARALSYSYSSDVLRKAGVSGIQFDAMASNNHMIIEEGELRNKLKKVKVGDYIEMKGYLVNAEIYNSAGQLERTVESSLTRSDHVEYAFDTRTSCEVMYLTSLDWLD